MRFHKIIITTAIVLLVSGESYAQCNFFTGFADNKDGTVTDTRNGLIWKRCNEGFDFVDGVCEGGGAVATNWEDAKLIAKSSHFLDKSDWRLPTKEEFESVLGGYDDCQDNQEGEYAASKAIAHMANWAWTGSASSNVSDPSAWGAAFTVGNVFWINVRDGSGNVKLVRAGQILGGEITLEFVNEPGTNEKRHQIMLAEERHDAREQLSAMSKKEFCVNYGLALRDLLNGTIGPLPKLEMINLVKKEARRRKLDFDDTFVRNEKIRMGNTQCQLYASWGLPKDENRTVGRWGTHIQHVYGGGTYVYIENGRLTSWQD